MVDSIDKSLPNTVEEVKTKSFKEKEVAVPGEEVITTDTSEVVMDEAEELKILSIQQRSLVDNQKGHFEILAETCQKQSYSL